MILWLAFAALTVLVLLAVLRPLTRTTTTAAGDPAGLAVYRDQLAEVEADAARGMIQPADAEIARREIARRLLAAAPADTSPTARSIALRPVVLSVAAALPVAAIATYVMLGSPGLPAAPFQSTRSAPLDQAPVADLVAKVEARLASNPNDGQGWEVIAPVYFRLNRYSEAANAYARAAALLGETPQRLAGFAEATVLAADGIVTEPARLAYEKIAKAEPERVEPKFWLALAKEQDGARDEAAAAYRALLATAPPQATWRALVEERLAAVTTAPAQPTSKSPLAGPPRGPSADDMAAASRMTDADRAQMIRGMVDGLAKRLEANPLDVPGWVRLVQSYAVLGERERALAALGEARRKLAGNAAALGELSQLARNLGLGS